MELFTIREVSKRLKMNTSDTYKLIKSGNLQALKLGSLKVTSYELERFIRDTEPEAAQIILAIMGSLGLGNNQASAAILSQAAWGLRFVPRAQFPFAECSS